MTHAYLWFLSLIAGRTAIVLLFLLIGLRFFGKRQIGQMNIYDLAMIMAIANAVQNAMTRGNGNVSVGIVSSGTLLLLGTALAFAFVRLPKLEDRIVGTPTLLINDGQFIEKNLRRERVTRLQLEMVLREHGLTDVRDVMLAMMEVDGAISIVPKTAAHHRRKSRLKRAGAIGEVPPAATESSGSAEHEPI